MAVSWLGVQALLFCFLLTFLTFLTKGTANEVTCKDRLNNCNAYRNLCSDYIYWMAKNCPETCRLCKKENPCAYKKCSYHSKCKAINSVMTKCVCQNLWSCPKSIFFVCGSDKITYRNRCTLKAIACRLKLDIKISSTGFCRYPCAKKKCQYFAKCDATSGVPKCKCPNFEDCPSIPRPLCDKNGVTHYNSCHWRVKSCRTNIKISILSRGRCAKKVQVGKLKVGESGNASCYTFPCPYYKLCREINGQPTCVKICPSPVCSCGHGVEYKFHLNGCKTCRCKQPRIEN